MVITADTIIIAGSVLAACLTIGGTVLKVGKWVRMTYDHDEAIKHMKKENALICYGLSACLDGLMQLGANHNVTIAKEKLDKHLNEQAHE